MDKRPTDGRRREATISVVATFTAFMHAYERGELAKAANAQAELEQLGVVVRFADAQVPQNEGGGHGTR